MEIQKNLPKAERQDLLEPWLVGLWEDLQLDPRVWGVVTRASRLPADSSPLLPAAGALFLPHLIMTPKSLQNQPPPAPSPQPPIPPTVDENPSTLAERTAERP
jgi:hypothetical protein